MPLTKTKFGARMRADPVGDMGATRRGGTRRHLPWWCLLPAVLLAACSSKPNVSPASTATSGRRSSPTSPSTTSSAARPAGTLSSGLWVSDIHANTVTMFGSPPASSPVRTLRNGLDHPEALAFDSQGNLWVGDGGAHPAILEYAAGTTASGSGPVTTIPTRGVAPEGLAFDARGNLWVAGGGVVLELAATSLHHAPSPARLITTPSLLDGPDAVAFDSQGNLWVANYDNRVLLEFPERSLSTSHPQPQLHVQLPGGAAPFAIAFDTHGDLWVACQNDKVYEYAASSLGTTDIPSATIDMSTFISGGVVGLAFDAQGDLWASAVGSSNSGAPEGTVYEYAASSLGTTDTPTAHLVASTSSNPGTWALAFSSAR